MAKLAHIDSKILNIIHVPRSPDLSEQIAVGHDNPGILDQNGQ
jgi:hypothetical protein